MQHLKQIVKALLAGESGQDMVEYALVAVFIGLAGVALLSGLESTLAGTFNRFGNVLTSSV
jgi:Flp pilus assembly pilin Flp